MRRVYHFSYPEPNRSNRNRRTSVARYFDIHRVRGSNLFATIKSILFSAGGYQHGGVILNLPSGWSPGLPKKQSSNRHSFVPLKGVAKDAVFVLGNRPPLDDTESKRNRFIQRSGTGLESRLLSAVRNVFTSVDRENATLSDAAKIALARKYPGRRRYEDVVFGIKNDARVSNFGATEDSAADVIVAYLYAIRIPPDRILLAAYGHGGFESFVFNELLASRPQMLLTALEGLSNNDVSLTIAEFNVSREYSYPLFSADLTEAQGERPGENEVVFTHLDYRV